MQPPHGTSMFISKVLTGRVLIVDERPVLLLQLDPNPAPELKLEASLPRVLLVLDDRLESGGHQHVPDFKDVGVGKTLFFRQESTF